jgi:hypothetical protein
MRSGVLILDDLNFMKRKSREAESRETGNGKKSETEKS